MPMVKLHAPAGMEHIGARRREKLFSLTQKICLPRAWQEQDKVSGKNHIADHRNDGGKIENG